MGDYYNYDENTHTATYNYMYKTKAAFNVMPAQPSSRNMVYTALVVLGQNGSGQNGTDKMVYGQNGIGRNGMDKMARTKWHG